MAALARLPPGAVAWADRQIAHHAGNDWRYEPQQNSLLGMFDPNRATFEILDQRKELATLFLFHHNGYVRQRALETLRAPPRSAFVLAALALRMNDWVGAVRVVARYRAETLLPKTAPEVIAAAAPFLLDRWRKWGRWDARSIAILDAAFQRPDVARVMKQYFLGTRPPDLRPNSGTS